MNDTVKKLMGMIDEYAESHSLTRGEREEKYQALQDELVKLFTPLTDEHIKSMYNRLCNTTGASYGTIARATEAAHGITGEKK